MATYSPMDTCLPTYLPTAIHLPTYGYPPTYQPAPAPDTQPGGPQHPHHGAASSSPGWSGFVGVTDLRPAAANWPIGVEPGSACCGLAP